MVKTRQKPKIGIIIQARQGSTRLPGKALLALPCGSRLTVLDQVFRRARRSRLADWVIVATTKKKRDDRIARKYGKNCFRGNENDVLQRYRQAAEAYHFDVIVRLTADNPAVDPAIIDRVIEAQLSGGNDYTYTDAYPLGMNVEAISWPALKQADAQAKINYHREHVTTYLLDHRAAFKVKELSVPGKLRERALRLTLDTPEDYAFFCAVFGELYPRDRYFGLGRVIKLVREQPWLKQINGRVKQKGRTDES